MNIESIPTKKVRGASKSPVSIQLHRYETLKTAKSAADLMIACATIGENLWDTLLDEEMATLISSDEHVEYKFLTNLCKQPGTLNGYEVISRYFQNTTQLSKDRFFCAEALKKKNHPARICLYGASFSSDSGKLLTKILSVIIDNGLCVDTLVNKNLLDVERAASLGNTSFLKIVMQPLTKCPEEIIRSVLTRSMDPIDSISILVDECGLSLENFGSLKMMNLAKHDTRSYISSRLSRSTRIPEELVQEDDSSEELFERTSALTH